MPTFVLVHPAWFGGWCWKKVVPALQSAGHTVHTPTLTGLGERAHLAGPEVGLGTHIADVVSALVFEDLDAVTLVGSSSGGTVVTAVADSVPERIERVVYLDAFVPADGQSTSDLVAPDRWAAMEHLVAAEGDGWLLPRFSPAVGAIRTRRMGDGERRRRRMARPTAPSDAHPALHRTGTAATRRPQRAPTPRLHPVSPQRSRAPFRPMREDGGIESRLDLPPPRAAAPSLHHASRRDCASAPGGRRLRLTEANPQATGRAHNLSRLL